MSDQYKGLSPYDLTPWVPWGAVELDIVRPDPIEYGTEGYFERLHLYARSKRWDNLRRQAESARQARLEQAIIKSIGKRHWQWLQERMHEDCGDY